MPRGQSEGANVSKQPEPWDSQRERDNFQAADQPIPRRRQAGDSQSRKATRDGIPYRTASRPPVANQVFLGSRTADIRQEVRRQSAPQRTLKAKQSGWTGETVRRTAHLRRRRSPSTWSSEMFRPGKGTKCGPNRVCAFVEYPRT